jgi:hypothetical protein
VTSTRGSISAVVSQARTWRTLLSTSTPGATSALMVMTRRPSTRRSSPTFGWARRSTKLVIGTIPVSVCTRIWSSWEIVR